jgi:hypothetical protein
MIQELVALFMIDGLSGDPVFGTTLVFKFIILVVVPGTKCSQFKKKN